MCIGMRRVTGQIFPKHPADEGSGEGFESRLLGCSSLEVGSGDIIRSRNSDRNSKVGVLGTFYGNPVAQKVQILLWGCGIQGRNPTSTSSIVETYSGLLICRRYTGRSTNQLPRFVIFSGCK